MVSINFGSLHTSQEDMAHSTRVDFDTTPMYHGRRSLLWFDEFSSIRNNTKANENEINFTESSDDKCPISINQTENLRLAGELRKWICVNDYLNFSSVQDKPVKFKLTPEFLELKSMSQPLAKPNSKRNERIISAVNRYEIKKDSIAFEKLP